MKPALVLDTNVLLVANGRHTGASDECRVACIERLLGVQQNGVTVLDDAHRILTEYRRKTRPNQPKEPGDAFLKWLLQNQANQDRVQTVAVSETSPNWFAEFADDNLQARFDPSDRKFVAVAMAHPARPAVAQAADSKWLAWQGELQAMGVAVELLCPEDLNQAQSRKARRRVKRAR